VRPTVLLAPDWYLGAAKLRKTDLVTGRGSTQPPERFDTAQRAAFDVARFDLTIASGPPLDARQLRGFVYRALIPDRPDVHEAEGPRPFSVAVREGRDARIATVAAIGRPVVRVVAEAAGACARGERPLTPAGVRVLAVSVVGEGWADLLRTTPSADAFLEFVTPVVFKRAGGHYPLPEPALVFGSLTNAWNAFAPIPCPPEVAARFGDATIRDGALRIAALQSHERIAGALGGLTYHLRNASDEERAWFACIARFARYAGVGARTTAGFGMIAAP
jgi:CRISPR-associated endoribonuclease Cas6